MKYINLIHVAITSIINVGKHSNEKYLLYYVVLLFFKYISIMTKYRKSNNIKWVLMSIMSLSK